MFDACCVMFSVKIVHICAIFLFFYECDTITTLNFMFEGKTGGGKQPLDMSDGSPLPHAVASRVEVSPTVSKRENRRFNSFFTCLGCL